VSSRFRGPAATLAGLATALVLASTAACGGAVAAPRTPAGSRPAPASQTVGGAELAKPGIAVNYPARGARRLPRVPASAYVLADANTGEVLAAKDAHGQFPPASTLKMLTAITLIPLLNPNSTVLATRRATSVEPNVVGLIAGHRYRVADLFRALLLISANDAAVTLTQATGSFDRGMALINAEARRLQADDVVAKQPNGLPAPGQYISAYDEALIARQALAIPAFMKYDSTLAARFKVKKRKWVTLVNQNTLLTHYRGGIGGKIGWTVKSKATYVGMARRHGVTLIVTVLHCRPLKEITSGESLLNWGFAMAGKVKPVGVLVKPLPRVAVSRQAAKPGRHATAGSGVTDSAQLASGHGGTGSPPAAVIAVIAGLIAAVAAGLGKLAWSRRRSAGPG
jgi:serine-type D-Ala-D-Ala carboxypeptidase (penicillin-binding protein 5/6)